jgi:hypothetical protein
MCAAPWTGILKFSKPPFANLKSTARAATSSGFPPGRDMPETARGEKIQ